MLSTFDELWNVFNLDLIQCEVQYPQSLLYTAVMLNSSYITPEFDNIKFNTQLCNIKAKFAQNIFESVFPHEYVQ